MLEPRYVLPETIRAWLGPTVWMFPMVSLWYVKCNNYGCCHWTTVLLYHGWSSCYQHCSTRTGWLVVTQPPSGTGGGVCWWRLRCCRSHEPSEAWIDTSHLRVSVCPRLRHSVISDSGSDPPASNHLQRLLSLVTVESIKIVRKFCQCRHFAPFIYFNHLIWQNKMINRHTNTNPYNILLKHHPPPNSAHQDSHSLTLCVSQNALNIIIFWGWLI